MNRLSAHYERALEIARGCRRYRTDGENIVVLPDDQKHTAKALQRITDQHQPGQSFTPKDHARLTNGIYRDMLAKFPAVEASAIRTNAGVLAAAFLGDFDGDQSRVIEIGMKLQATLSDEQHEKLKQAHEEYSNACNDALLIAMVAGDTDAPLEIAAAAISVGSAAFDRSLEATGDIYAASMVRAGAMDDVLLANGQSPLSGDLAGREEILAAITSGDRGFQRRAVSDDELAVITEHARKLD